MILLFRGSIWGPARGCQRFLACCALGLGFRVGFSGYGLDLVPETLSPEPKPFVKEYDVRFILRKEAAKP